MALLLRRVGAGQQYIKRHANTPPQKRVHGKSAACIIKLQCSCLVTTCNGQQQKASSAPYICMITTCSTACSVSTIDVVLLQASSSGSAGTEQLTGRCIIAVPAAGSAPSPSAVAAAAAAAAHVYSDDVEAAL
jgi:hypothetical protein